MPEFLRLGFGESVMMGRSNFRFSTGMLFSLLGLSVVFVGLQNYCFVPGTLWLQAIVSDSSGAPAYPSLQLTDPPVIPVKTFGDGTQVLATDVVQTSSTLGANGNEFMTVDGLEVATGQGNNLGVVGAKISHYIGVTQLPGAGFTTGLRTLSVRNAGVSTGTSSPPGTIGYEMDHDNIDKNTLVGQSQGLNVGMRIHSQSSYPSLAALYFDDAGSATFGWHYGIFVNGQKGDQFPPILDSTFKDLGAATTSFNIAGIHQVGFDTSGDQTKYAIMSAAGQKFCFNGNHSTPDNCLSYEPNTPGSQDYRLRYRHNNVSVFSIDASGNLHLAGEAFKKAPMGSGSTVTTSTNSSAKIAPAFSYQNPTPSRARGLSSSSSSVPRLPATLMGDVPTPQYPISSVAVTTSPALKVCPVSNCPAPDYVQTAFITETHSIGNGTQAEILNLEDLVANTGAGGGRAGSKVAHYMGVTQINNNAGTSWALDTDVYRGSLGVDNINGNIGGNNSTISFEVDMANFDSDAKVTGQPDTLLVGSRIMTKSAFPSMAGIYFDINGQAQAQYQYGFIINGNSVVKDNSFADYGSAGISLYLSGSHVAGVSTVTGTMPYAVTVAAGQQVCFGNQNGCFSYDATNNWLVFNVNSKNVFYVDNSGNAYFPMGYTTNTTP